MKIGIFDSGLGGLLITRAIRKLLPQYNYVYFGDTARMPYGNRSKESILNLARSCIEYLFNKEDCAMVIIACNTVSSIALRKIQQEYLPIINSRSRFKQHRVLGVLIPVAEECAGFKLLGVLGTRNTISSNTFTQEIKKINNKAKIFTNSAPILASLAEEGETRLALPFIKKYVKPIIKKKIEAIILGCTHYPIFKKEFKSILSKKIKILSQDEIIPEKLKKYLENHTEISKKLDADNKIKILVTELTPNIERITKKWFSSSIKPVLVKIK